MKLFKKISGRLLAGFIVVMIAVCALGYSSWSAISGLGKALDGAVNGSAQKLRLVGELQTGFQEMRAEATKVEISMNNIIIGRLAEGQRNSDLTCGACHTPDTVDTQRQRFEAAANRVTAEAAQLRPLMASPAEKQAEQTIEAGITQWVSLYHQYLQLMGGRDYTGAHDVMLDKIYPLIEGMDKAAKQLTAQQEALLASASRDAGSRVSHSRSMAIVLMALCLLAGAAVQWIVRGVNRVLRQFVGEIVTMSGHITDAARQLAASSQSLAEGASEQAASLEETSASAEQVHATTRSNAAHCQTVSTTTGHVNQQITEANGSLQDMTESMKAISGSSSKIAQIIKVIDGIAFQTNILALNAAVEAARAGEAGLGFAVVADEVRNLAQRCAQAAKDTASLIEESTSLSTQGTSKVNLVAGAIQAITGSAAEVQGLINEVSVANHEQARGIEQITKALSQIDQVTQKTAKNAEDNAACGEELSTQSHALKRVADELAALV
ncbi:MAG TPA: methyl-accepting chemotaxis protein [Bryobacteraceae bacterium]|nr:methyl-accepting chemotaxis protein [Bryobacteraceae bacterium]